MDKPTILVVEDEPLILLILQTALEDAGFAVLAASDGEQAEVVIESGTALHGLVADINHPGQISGWDVARLARVPFPHLAVVYTTGHGELDWPSHGVPGSTLIVKPYAPAQVVIALSNELNSAG